MASIKGPDFSKSQKDVLMVTLPDGTKLSVKPPTKGVFDRLQSLAGAIDDVVSGEMDGDDFDLGEALGCVAEIMSNNTAYKRIEPEFLDASGFDIEDIGTFVGAYVLFITQLVEAKN